MTLGARAWLLGVLAAGVLLGIGKLVRGAHYPSHTLWSAWICWAICAGAEALHRVVTVLRAPAAPASQLLARSAPPS